MVEVSLAPDGRTVVVPPGELWLATTPALIACVEDLISAGVRDVTVELAPVSLLCSDGVRAILHCEGLLKAAGGSLSVRNPTGVVNRVVELTPLSRVVAAG